MAKSFEEIKNKAKQKKENEKSFEDIKASAKNSKKVYDTGTSLQDFKKWASGVESLSERLSKYVDTSTYKAVDDSLKDEVSSYLSQTDSMLEFIRGNRSQFEDYSKALSQIYSTKNSLNQAISDIKKASSFYSNWGNEEGFTKELEQTKAYLKDQEEKRTYDLEAGMDEIEALKAELAKTREEAESYVPSTPSEEYLKQETTPEARERAIREFQYRQRQNWNYAVEDLENQIAEKEKYLSEAERIQTAYKLASVSDPESEFYDPNFNKYAQMGEAIENPSYDDVKKGKGEIQNPVKYVKENYNKLSVDGGTVMSGGRAAEVNGMNIIYYAEMKDDEYKTYNYYLAQDNINSRNGKPTNNADEYLKSLNLEDRYREGQMEFIAGYANEHPVAASAISVATSLGSSVEHLKNIFNYVSTGEMDSSLMAEATNTIRSTVSGNVDWEIGNWDAFDFLYNTGMSGVDSLTSGLLFGPAGGAVLGLSAAAQGTNDALDRGMTGSKVFWNGLMAGVFEGLFETVSIGQFNALKDGFVSGGKDIIKNLAKTMLVNASEETLTEIANLTYDRMVNGDFSQYEVAVRRYMEEEGLSEAEAKNRVAREQALQVVEAGASGALMGFGFGLGGSLANTISSRIDGKAIKNAGMVDKLVEMGRGFSPGSEVRQFAGNISKDSSPLAIGRLLKGIQGSLSAQNLSDIQTALVEKGVTAEEAAKLAKWMNHVVEGGTLTKKQQMALEMNDVLGEVLYGTIIQPNSTVMQRKQTINQLYDIASSMGVDRQALEAQQTPEAITQRMNDRRAFGEALRRGANSRMGLSEADIAQIDEVAAKIRKSSAPSSEKIADVADKVSDTGATFVKSTGEEVSIKKIASIDVKNKTMKLELSNGKVVDSKDIAYGDNNQAALYESVLQMGYDAHSANAIVSGYTPSSTVSVEDYLIGTRQAFNYGWGHIPEKARTGVGYKALTQEQREHAYKVGEDARAADDKVRGVKAAQNQPQTAKKKAKSGYGAKLSVDKNAVTDRVAKSVKALDAVAKALKLNMTIADLRGNAYGYYNSSTNELIIDVNAGGNGKHTLLFTASHELVHYIRNWSPEKFTVLADFLMEQYAAKGEDIDARIDDEIKKAYNASRGKHQMTYDEAYEEVVAQAMQRFLTDSNFIERLADLQKKDANLAKRLVAKLKEILDNIRAAYQGMDTNDRASQAVKEMGEAANELYAKMEEALIAASKASHSIGARNLEDFSEAKNTDGKDLFQYKAMEADEETYRQMLKKHGIMSEAEINKLFSTIDKALAIIKNNLEVLDYAWEADIDDRAYSPVKSNSDNLYKVSLDFSTLCRKRILQQVIQTQLQDALNKPLSREESIAIRDELMKIQEEGRQIEIACALCYVESARMKSPAQIKKFLKDRDNVIKEFLASKSGGDIKQKIKQAEADARERLGVGKAPLKSMPDKIADQIRLAKREAKKSYTPTAEEQKLIDVAKKMRVTDFTSPEGLSNLAKNYPVLFDAYTSYVRNATHSKGIEKDTWWRAGDSKSIGDTLIANMNRENGLRSQSWSDFQVIHLLDYIAATIELSTRNAKEQAYSKVPDYIELMGNTGVMLNMSLIPMAKFNGKLEYDSVEGMTYKKALELRDKYHATAGTICIGISDEQIKMLLDDSSIDYVIPYHKSSMAAHIRKLMHIPTWSDYEKYQIETNLSRSEAEKQAKKYGVTLLSESDPNYQKHTAFSEWFDIEEARQIAKQENAFPTDVKLQKKYGVMYGGYMAMQNAADNYLKLCAERGIAPKFSHENANFTEEANYWKLIIDRKMVDNVTGDIIEQQAIKPIFDEGEILRILNDELERYPSVKADQDYAVRTVVEKFLSGEMNKRLDADTVAAIMQKPVDNITTTNIIASEEGIKAQYAEGEMFEEDKYYARQIDKWESLKDTSYITVGVIKENSPLNRIGMTSGNLYFDVSKIKEAMSDHKDHLSKDILKDIPKLLNNPIVIVEYNVGKNMNTANVYGELYYHGTPITVGIVATLSRGKTVISKVRTVHARRDFATQITDDSILFLGENKKETNRWFQAQGQPVPMRGTKYGFIRSIHDIPQNVNTNQNISSTDLKAQYIDTDYAPAFYSQMGKVVEGVKQEKLAANSIVNMLRGKGVKAEEIRWSGIVPFLDGKKSVTKQELLDFINSSMLRIGEQMSTNDIALRYDSSNHAYIHYDSNGNVIDTYTYSEFLDGYVSEASEEIYSDPYELEDALREEYGKMASPRWAEYKLDGGSNYREIVFTLPNSSYSNQMMRTHWGDDAEGVLVHARIQDFDVNGKKMLFVEEIQSDWHNEGHKNGYETEITSEEREEFVELEKIIDALNEQREALNKEKGTLDIDYFRGEKMSFDEYSNKSTTLIDKLEKTTSKLNRSINKREKIYSKLKNAAPDAPFKDTYHEYVMKRLLRMAAENGYDSIGWTPADIQDERWSDHQHHADGRGKSGNLVGYTIEYDQDIPKFLRKYGRQWGANVSKTTLDGISGGTRFVTDTGREFSTWVDAQNAVVEEANELLAELGEDNRVSVRDTTTTKNGNEIKVFDGLGRELGTITNVGNSTEVWSMDITDSMKNSVLYEGQAMFQYKEIDPIDNRSLLAKSLEGAAKNDIEKTKLNEYKKKIDLINAEEKKLRELRAQIKEISFSKGPRDTEKLKKLQFEANQAANRINVYDKQLLRLEATKPLMDVVQREKELVRKKMDQQRKKDIAAVKEKNAAAIREIMDRNTESRKKAVEGRNKTQMRQKIKSVVGELNQLLLKGTKDKHVMIGLQRAVASALDAVNMDTVGADERIAKYNDLIAKAKDPDVIASLQETRDRIKLQGDNMNERLTALKNAYNEIKNSKDPLIANSHDEVIESKIESVVNSIGETPLRDMTLEQLEDVYDMYKMVLTTIRNSNKAFKMDKAESIASLGNNVMGEIESIAGSKEYTVKALEGIKKFGWNSLKPTQAFELMGSGTFKKVFANVRAGEDAWAVDINEAREYYREKSKKYKYDSWDLEKKYDFLSKTGKPFRLSLEQIMSLYAYSKRKQADLHLDQGGFVFDEAIEVVEKKKGIPVKYKVNTARAYSISKDALTVIIDKLTAEQKAFVDEMQTYLSETMGEKGNEVSLEMYGVKLFKEKHYFPLKSAKQFMFEQNEVAGEVRIKNSGFSKETVVNANNPIILSNFMDVWAKHVNDMSMYHAFVLPLEDFNRVFNYKTPTGDKLDTESVKMCLQNAYGTQPVQYIKQLLTDLNGGARVEPNADIINKGIALFKKGAVFASASVVIQQPSAIARAFAYVDPKYFATAKADLRKHSQDWEECKQYAPVARIKEMGYFDTNVGMQTTDWITAKEYKGFKEKIKGLKDSKYRDELLSKAPALADELSWTYIWNAVKKEVASTTNLAVGSEEFLKRAGERFTEVVVNTQVYDSVLTRNGLMRSKDTGMKMATAFMAEPTTSLNMIVNSFVQAKRGNKKFARKIAGAVTTSIILNSIFVSLVYAARDDDDDETYAEKYLGSLMSELLDGFNPITYIPFAKDIWSIAQGYDVERSDMSAYSKLWESFEELFDKKKSVSDKVLDFSGSVATLFGFPLKNIARDVKAMINLATNELGIKDTTKAGIGYSLSDSLRNSIPLLGRFYEEDTKAEKLYDALVSGNKTQISRATSGYKDEEAVESAMRSEIKERYLSGNLDYSTASEYLEDYSDMESEDVYWKMREWDYEKEHGNTEGYSKYSDFHTAVQTGKNIKAIIKEYTSHGVTEKTLASQITSHFKPLYIEMSRYERAGIKGYLLNAYVLLGYNRTEKSKDIDKWLEA